MKLCDTCIYRNNVEQLKPCIIYRDDCEYYEKERGDMTREEAISIMNVIIHMLEPQYDTDRIEDAVDMAIKALEQEPCDDAVSRQIISDYVESHIQEINTGYGDLNKHTNEILRMIVNYIEKMEPVTPQPKMGHWSHDGSHWKNRFICSECNYKLFDEPTNYCPNCGAKMSEIPTD